MAMFKLVGTMAVFVALGSPLVWYLWETLNQVLSGQIIGPRLLISLGVLLLLVALLTVLSRSVQRWEGLNTD